MSAPLRCLLSRRPVRGPSGPGGRNRGISVRPWQNAPVDSGESGDRTGTVVVQSGQTLYSIARANDLTPDQLARANGIAPPYAIQVGQS
jgi:hypothetical protein